MKQLLPRGYPVTDNKRIKRMVAHGPDWQIYLTNQDTYVLAVTCTLYNNWVEKCSLPDGLFLPQDTVPMCRVFASRDSYLVSSIKMGPYPENSGQIEAFSVAFHTAVQRFSDMDLSQAIYLEKYSLLLPTVFTSNDADNKVVLGMWITGGVRVSVDSFERVKEIMSWLPDHALARSIELAGFHVVRQPAENKNGEELAPEKEEREIVGAVLSGGGFVLTGRPELQTFIQEHIIDVVLNPDQYKRMGIPFPGATILYGPPGCGKTYAVEKLSEYLGWKRFEIDSSTIASTYIHDTSKKISEVFQSAMDSAPSIIVIDEMEAFLTDRRKSGPSGIYHIEEVAEFLREIPKAIAKGVLVFAMTNMIEAIDPAILRRGRFDYIIEVKPATAEEIEALLQAKCKDLPVEETVDKKEIAAVLAGRPLSDVTFVLREAGRHAVKNGLERINTACFDNAFGLLPEKKKRAPIGFQQNEDRSVGGR